MSGAARLGDLLTTNGHGPNPAISTGSNNVFINFIPSARAGEDMTTGHVDKYGQPNFDPTLLGTGSPTVFVNAKPLSRIGDLTVVHSDVDPGPNNVHLDSPHADIIIQGSTNVFVNGA